MVHEPTNNNPISLTINKSCSNSQHLSHRANLVTNVGHEISIIAPILRKGDIPQKINVTGESRRWLRFTYDKCL